MQYRVFFQALTAALLAAPGSADLRGGVSQIDFGNFPEFTAHVVVEDDAGHSVRGVTPADVTVTEDTVPVSVSSVVPVAEVQDRSSMAISIVLGIDNSASMLGRETQLEKAVGAFLDELSPADRVAVIRFAGGLESELQVTGFTANKQAIKADIHLDRLSPKTYLRDMVWRSATLLEEESLLGRRAIVVFSDGHDLGSRRSFAQALQRVREAETPVYAVELTAQDEGGNSELMALAERTGGGYYFSPDPDGLVGLYQGIRGQLLKQYRITYVSPDPSLEHRKREIQVTIRSGRDSLTSRKTVLLDPDKVKVAVAVAGGSKEDLLSMLDRFPDGKWTDDITYRLGLVLEEEGNLDDAARYYEALVSDFPESQWSDDAYFRLASAYLKAGNGEQALKASQDLLARFPQSEWADDMLFQAGSICMQKGEVAHAQGLLEDLITRFPDSEWVDDAQFSVGRAYVQAGDLIRAAAAYQRVVDVAPGGQLAGDARYELGRIYVEKGEWENAEGQLALFRGELLPSARAPEALVTLGEVYRRQGSPAKAEAVYELLRASFPGHEAVSRIPAGPTVTPSQEVEPAMYEYYTVREGDWLSKLALRLLGDAHQWPRLHEINKDTIKDPDLILVGQRIRIMHQAR